MHWIVRVGGFSLIGWATAAPADSIRPAMRMARMGDRSFRPPAYMPVQTKTACTEHRFGAVDATSGLSISLSGGLTCTVAACRHGPDRHRPLRPDGGLAPLRDGRRRSLPNGRRPAGR